MLTKSDATRAALALAVLLGFYALGLLISIGLIWIAVAGLTVLWSLRPRRDRFAPPGPEITGADQPELFALLQKTAHAMGLPHPATVFLVDGVSAFVADRGGVMGLGTRTVMGFGLPLVQILSLRELRAVIAHELAHCSLGQRGVTRLLNQTEQALAPCGALEPARSFIQDPNEPCCLRAIQKWIAVDSSNGTRCRATCSCQPGASRCAGTKPRCSA